MPQPHLTAVTIPDMRSTFFVVNFTRELLPDSEDWGDWPIHEGVRLEVAPDLFDWPDEPDDYEPPILCQSVSDPGLYRVFKRSADIPAADFARTGWAYGGGYREARWTRFTELLPRFLEFCRIPDTDSTESIDAALQPLRARE